MGKRYCINEKQKYNYKDERKGNGMVEERRKKKEESVKIRRDL